MITAVALYSDTNALHVPHAPRRAGHRGQQDLFQVRIADATKRRNEAFGDIAWEKHVGTQQSGCGRCGRELWPWRQVRGRSGPVGSVERSGFDRLEGTCPLPERDLLGGQNHRRTLSGKIQRLLEGVSNGPPGQGVDDEVMRADQQFHALVAPQHRSPGQRAGGEIRGAAELVRPAPGLLLELVRLKTLEGPVMQVIGGRVGRNDKAPVTNVPGQDEMTAEHRRPGCWKQWKVGFGHGKGHRLMVVLRLWQRPAEEVRDNRGGRHFPGGRRQRGRALHIRARDDGHPRRRLTGHDVPDADPQAATSEG